MVDFPRRTTLAQPPALGNLTRGVSLLAWSGLLLGLPSLQTGPPRPLPTARQRAASFPRSSWYSFHLVAPRLEDVPRPTSCFGDLIGISSSLLCSDSFAPSFLGCECRQ